MKIGIPVFNDRVSPVFDWARNLMIVVIGEAGEAEGSRIVGMDELGEWERVTLLVSEGINVLICAGICGTLIQAITGRGIQVIPGIVGHVDDVLEAYKNGRLFQQEFCMPGYKAAGNQLRRRRGRGRLNRGDKDSSKFGFR